MDYFNNFSNDWFSHAQIKIKGIGLNIFLNKKILIYGLGKTGLSAFKFLKSKGDIFLYDDLKSNIESSDIKKKIITYKKVLKLKFDKIILSPGIDINNCNLSKFLKKIMIKFILI